jgi:hypothetical protein
MFWDSCESAIQYCETVFHRLWHAANEDKPAEAKPSDGSLEINGVRLPAYVVEELNRLGVSLSAYSTGELEAAVQACAFDRKLIDDPNGLNFMDELELTNSEERAKTGDETTISPLYSAPAVSFCDKLKQERENKLYGNVENDDVWVRRKAA